MMAPHKSPSSPGTPSSLSSPLSETSGTSYLDKTVNTMSWSCCLLESRPTWSPPACPPWSPPGWRTPLGYRSYQAEPGAGGPPTPPEPPFTCTLGTSCCLLPLGGSGTRSDTAGALFACLLAFCWLRTCGGGREGLESLGSA